MKKLKRNKEQGFSAIELLITLFVAAAFLATGYQLYYTLLEGSGLSRMRAIANNVAYDKLRFYAAQATDPCTSTFSPTPTPTIPAGSGLGDTQIYVYLTCPFGYSSSVTRVYVQINYGPANTSLDESTHHVIYATPNL